MKKIERVKARLVSASITCTDGSVSIIRYDFGQQDYFSDCPAAQEWLRKEVESFGIEYDERKLSCALMSLWIEYTKH